MPGYAALIVRRTYQDLARADAIMTRVAQWLAPTEATWLEKTHTWTFPSGATLSFGHMEHSKSVFGYQGAAFQFVGYDELTQFEEIQYTYMLSRLRRLAKMDVPLRLRGTGNPGGIGHEWVKARFIDPGDPDRPFIPARLSDNPGLDHETYEAGLSSLPSLYRRQLRDGDWSARDEGGKFKREWFQIVDDYPRDARIVRAWDRASRPKQEGKSDPDWTAGVKLAMKDGQFWIVDVVRAQTTPKGVEDLVRQCAELDGRHVQIRFAEERGSSGIAIVDHFARNVVLGFSVEGIKETGDIEVRADPLSSAAELGNLKLVRGAWNSDFIDEAVAFPDARHDDMVAATCVAHYALCFGGQISTKVEGVGHVRLATKKTLKNIM